MLTMLKKDFWYDLPKELIAQEPASPRDAARLMVLSQKDDSIQHRIFHDLPEYLEPGDLLVVNNSKVLPARIVGIKQPTGAVCELLLLRQVKGDQWECLAKPGKRMQPGTKVSFGDGSLTAIVDETLEDGNKFVTFYYDTETLYEKLDEFGKMPLPPYITKQLDDQSQYQTVYAKELGSAAAPTAGLHFTPELMDTIRAKGVNITEVTLHVGLGTFRPVQEDEIADHKMHSEWYSVSEETAKLIHDTKAAGHRVIAVGTTSCRTLEAVAAKYGEIKACSGNTDIFLYPGVKFNCIDGLITNFHLPESTLVMLVSALAGREHILAAYEEAVADCGLPQDDLLIRYGNSMENSAQSCLDELLEQKCDALVVAQGLMASETVIYLHKKGLKLGEDIDLVTFVDYDSDINYLYSKQMDCIIQPVEKLGETAGELILQRIETPDAPAFEQVLTSTYQPCGM